MENYRPITLSPTIAKIFSKLIETRIQNTAKQQQPIEQAGFRKSFSTLDHLHAINQIIEKCSEYQVEVHIAMVDYNKAFDSLTYQYMLEALENQGILKNFINLIREMYTGLEGRIITDKEGKYFKINKGGG